MFRVIYLAIVAIAVSVLNFAQSSTAADGEATTVSLPTPVPANPLGEHVEPTLSSGAPSIGIGSILAGDSTVALALYEAAVAPVAPAAPAADRDAPTDFTDLDCPVPAFDAPDVPEPVETDAIYDACMAAALANWTQEYQATIVPLYEDACEMAEDWWFLDDRIEIWAEFYFVNKALCDDGDPIACVSAQVFLSNIQAAVAEQNDLRNAIDGLLQDALDEFDRIDALYLAHAAACLEDLNNR